MGFSTDIDIDFADRDRALENLWHVPATIIQRGNRTKHKTGVYFQNIPVDPTDGFAAYEYENASERGFYKLDFLNNSIYEHVRSEKHLDELLNKEPVWELFEDEEIVGLLAHLGENFEVVQKIMPRSIHDLAVCLAIMRPGKRYLLNKPRNTIDAEIWIPTKEYYFKKAHAYAFAGSIIVQLNLIIEEALRNG